MAIVSKLLDLVSIYCSTYLKLGAKSLNSSSRLKLRDVPIFSVPYTSKLCFDEFWSLLTKGVVYGKPL